MISTEIAPGDRSGGATTSHTIVLPALVELLAAVPYASDWPVLERAVLEDNVLGKDTVGARQRTLRYLRELYVLNRGSLLYRALCDLWNDDPAGRPLLAGLCALARDPVFRASSAAILNANPGDQLANRDLADAVAKVFPNSYNDSTLAKIGRNTFASWEQTGHLAPAGRMGKVRKRATCTASTVAFALLLGHLEGVTGAPLFDTLWARVLDQPPAHLLDLATVASQRSLIDFRHSGGVIEVGFSALMCPAEDRLL